MTTIVTHPIDRFLRRNTRKTAIDAFCAHCMGEEINPPRKPQKPGYRTSIANCTSTGCPLHDWRPYK